MLSIKRQTQNNTSFGLQIRFLEGAPLNYGEKEWHKKLSALGGPADVLYISLKEHKVDYVLFNAENDGLIKRAGALSSSKCSLEKLLLEFSECIVDLFKQK